MSTRGHGIRNTAQPGHRNNPLPASPVGAVKTSGTLPSPRGDGELGNRTIPSRLRGDGRMRVTKDYFTASGPGRRKPLRNRGRRMSLFIQQMLNGVMLGSVYSLVALGLTLEYGILHIPNFAHGALYMVGAYFTFLLATYLGLNFWLAMILSMIALGLIGVLVERLVLSSAHAGIAPELLHRGHRAHLHLRGRGPEHLWAGFQAVSTYAHSGVSCAGHHDHLPADYHRGW